MDEERHCRNCGDVLPNIPHTKSGPRPVHCNDVCKKEYKDKRGVAMRAAKRAARKCGRCGESLGDAGGPPNVRTCDRCRSEVAEEKEAARKVWEAARAVKRAESEARVAAVAAAPPKKMGRPRGSQNAEAKAGEANRTLAIRSHLETALWMREHEIRERFKERAPVTTS